MNYFRSHPTGAVAGITGPLIRTTSPLIGITSTVIGITSTVIGITSTVIGITGTVIGIHAACTVSTSYGEKIWYKSPGAAYTISGAALGAGKTA